MSTDQATHAFEQRLLAEQARQKKILDDASAQAILQAQLQQQLKNLQGQLDQNCKSYEDLLNLSNERECNLHKALSTPSDALPDYCE